MAHANMDTGTVDFVTRGTGDDTLSLGMLIAGVDTSPALAAAFAAHCPAPWALVAISYPADPTLAIERLRGALRSTEVYAIGTVVDNVGFALVEASSAPAVGKAVLASRESAGYTVAVSLPFDKLSAAARQGKLLFHCLAASDEPGLVEAQDQALDFIREEILSTGDFESLTHPALRILRDYDNANQSNMLETLRVYLENDRNAQRCASILYLHRNSLQYRIKRIQEIAGLNLNDKSERTWLRLSFFLQS